jgi:hypothetical protein
MTDPHNTRPLDGPEAMATALLEQELTPDEVRAMTSILMRLNEWQPPVPTSEETEQLIQQLLSQVPSLSPVRRARRARRRSLRGDFTRILHLARTQVSILRPTFWLLSALVTLLGGVFVLSRTSSDTALVLLALGPFWSYLGTVSVFRGVELNVLELELACPPSPRQLLLARLVVVLGYDVLLGMGLSVLLSSQGAETVLVLTLHWLAPLLLIAGVTLLLSLHMTVSRAASISYGSWLVILLSIWVVGQSDVGAAFTLGSELALGLFGIACLALAVRYAGPAKPQLLPRRR